MPRYDQQTEAVEGSVNRLARGSAFAGMAVLGRAPDVLLSYVRAGER